MNFLDYDATELACNESFQRYCREECETDMIFWSDWIARHPVKAAVVAEARQLVEILSARQGGRAEQLKHLKDGLAQYDLLQEALMEPVPVMTARQRLPVWKYAAIVGGVLVLAAGTFFFSRYGHGTMSGQPGATIIASGEEPRKSVVLPDGSSLILRKNSRVELAPGFNLQNRELTLTGEAFFDVYQNAKLPFTVHTALLDIKVLGTVFNVSAYVGHPATEAALFRGKVEITCVQQPQQKIVLQPNQKLTILTAPTDQPSTKAPLLKVVPLDADPVDHKAREIAWVRNRLEIENEPLSEIAGKLEQWYGIRIAFADEAVKQYRYSGTFESETILKALDALQLSYPFNFKMVNDTIIISK
ncbi:FecR family protein [Chitinophaga sp. HK235]|uniref:FecR family protein n=1 Tax=Chitinophaga sp. HK235 TaxID=2952571 RepID=UPI001BAD7A4B|nr:FecR domain-containing protein [Chitinophaga sp. HK235]